MSDGVRVDTAQLQRYGEVLRHAEAPFRRGLRVSLEDSGKELARTVFRKGAQVLGAGGGLGAAAAAARGKVSTKVSGSTTTVTVVGVIPQGYSLAGLDTGEIRHPVFAHRQVWVSQHIRAHAFSDEIKKQTPMVEKRLVTDTQHTLDTIGREASRG